MKLKRIFVDRQKKKQRKKCPATGRNKNSKQASKKGETKRKPQPPSIEGKGGNEKGKDVKKLPSKDAVDTEKQPCEDEELLLVQNDGSAAKTKLTILPKNKEQD